MNTDENYQDEKLVLSYIMPLAQTRKRMTITHKRMDQYMNLERRVEDAIYTIQSHSVLRNVSTAAASVMGSTSNMLELQRVIDKMDANSDVIKEMTEPVNEVETDENLNDIARSIVMKIMLPDLGNVNIPVLNNIVNSGNDDNSGNGPT